MTNELKIYHRSFQKRIHVSDVENMVTLAKVHPDGCGLCTGDVNTGKLQKNPSLSKPRRCPSV